MYYLLAALTFSVFSLAFLLFKQYQKMRGMDQILKDQRADPLRWTFTDQQLIHNASEKADLIVSKAEVMALQIAMEKIMESNLFEENLKKKFDESFEVLNLQFEENFKNIQAQLDSSLNNSEAKHLQFVTQLEKQSVAWSNRIQDELQSKVTGLLFDFEQKLTDFFAGAEQKSLDAINVEIKSARQLIESYKSQQLSILDENIVAVLERTMNLILQQKLTLKDQTDMVYEALEKAKLEKFLA